MTECARVTLRSPHGRGSCQCARDHRSNSALRTVGSDSGVAMDVSAVSDHPVHEVHVAKCTVGGRTRVSELAAQRVAGDTLQRFHFGRVSWWGRTRGHASGQSRCTSPGCARVEARACRRPCKHTAVRRTVRRPEVSSPPSRIWTDAQERGTSASTGLRLDSSRCSCHGRRT